MSFFKIDSSLLGVRIANKMDIKYILYVKDFLNSRKILKNNPNLNIIGEYPFISAFAVESGSGEIFALALNSWVEYISSVKIANALMYDARKKVNVDVLHKEGYTGKGVRVAIIDTGCYPHIDFLLGRNRVVEFVDLVNERTAMYDDNGHGTFVTGVLAGSGAYSKGKYCGIAPGCDLIILKALNSDGQTQAFKVLDAMQWVYENRKKYNIKVVCMSFGSTPLARNDPLSLGASSLWDAGITVVSAVGNDGPKPESVKSPGSCSKIITVGCADTTKVNIEVADFSSRGPIFDIIKPDLIAPGVDITSLANGPVFLTQMTGSSVSTPFVAGVAALLLERNPYLLPNQIKSLIMYSANRLDCSPNDCGMGVLNAKAAFDY